MVEGCESIYDQARRGVNAHFELRLATLHDEIMEQGAQVMAAREAADEGLVSSCGELDARLAEVALGLSELLAGSIALQQRSALHQITRTERREATIKRLKEKGIVLKRPLKSRPDWLKEVASWAEQAPELSE